MPQDDELERPRRQVTHVEFDEAQAAQIDFDLPPDTDDAQTPDPQDPEGPPPASDETNTASRDDTRSQEE